MRPQLQMQTQPARTRWILSIFGQDSSSSFVESQQDTPSLGDVKVKVDQDVEVHGDTAIVHIMAVIDLLHGPQS